MPRSKNSKRRGSLGATYVDDNFGHYDIESEEDIDFYNYMQANSVRKKCSGCGRMVKIKRDYAYCNSCATTLERGGDPHG